MLQPKVAVPVLEACPYMYFRTGLVAHACKMYDLHLGYVFTSSITVILVPYQFCTSLRQNMALHGFKVIICNDLCRDLPACNCTILYVNVPAA